MSETASLGRLMLFWAALIGLSVWGLQLWLDKRYNPNSGLAASAEQALILAPDRYHQYYVDGAINGVAVTFLVDTGASKVSIPATIAEQAGLKGGVKHWATTANGSIQVESTIIKRLNVAGFELSNIRASINPHMDDDLILLGMSAIKYFNVGQEGDAMVLRRPSL